MRFVCGVSTIAVLAGLAVCGSATAADEQSTLLDQLIIVGSASQALEVGGSADYIDSSELRSHAYSDVNRILRTVPGVSLQEEDGFGLRPNIAIRGSGSDRSSRITLMEDGILIAPAPYAAPSAYYFPRMARMDGIEVVKGPAAIKYGPLTTGGALQFFTPRIPELDGAAGGHFDLIAGDDGALQLEGLLGGWSPDNGGWQFGASLQGLHEESDGFKLLDGGGETGFEIDDLVFKLGARNEDAAMPQAIEFKYQTLDEVSNETYLGLTLPDFVASPFRRYRGSQEDVMNVDHQTWQATHNIALSPNLELTTTAYKTETARAWYKLNDVRAGGGFVGIGSVLEDPSTYAGEYATLVGDPALVSAADALRVRNNNRAYEAEGIQSVLTARFTLGGADHALEVSARRHRDEEDRFQQDDLYQMNAGEMVLTTAGAPGSQTNRIGDAKVWSFFVRDTIDFGRLTLTPGLRYEQIDLRRTNYSTNDPARTAPTSVVRSDLDVLIPGLGALYRVNDNWSLFGGAHRGFANPSPGSSADAETSWNYEVGARYGNGPLFVEGVVFLNDYDNLVGTCTASTGGGCAIGDQFDGGEAQISGIEFTASYDFGARAGWGVGVPVALIFTHTSGEFQTSFNSGFGPWGTVTAGDEMPHLPEYQVTLTAGLDGVNWRANAILNHVSEDRETAGSGAIAADDRIDARTLLDVSGEFDIRPGVSLFGAVTNLTDEVYNVSFSPAGARPGAPRTVRGGLRLRF